MLDLTSGIPSPDLRQALKLQRNARVWNLHRLRLLEGRAMIVETSAIPVELAPGLDEHRGELDWVALRAPGTALSACATPPRSST